MAKKKSYYITAAIFVLISGFFSQYIKYEVESFRFLKIFMNKYADTVIYLEQKNSSDSFFTKKSKAVKMRKELGEKISRINKYAGSEAGNEPEFLSEMYNKTVGMTVQQALSEEAVRNKMLNDKLISDVYNNKAVLKRNAGFISGIKNGFLTGVSYPVSVKDKFISLTDRGESLPVSIIKAYFVSMADYLKIGMNCFLFYGLPYKAGYAVTWLISAFLTVILVFLPFFLLKPKKRPKTTYGF